MVQPRFRVRSGRIVTLETESIAEIEETGDTIVEVDGFDVQLRADENGIAEHPESDYSLLLGPEEPRRLLSGFACHFYNVLDGHDLLLLADTRLPGEDEIVENAGGYVDLKSEEDLEEDEEDVTSEIDELDQSDPVEADRPSDVNLDDTESVYT